MPKIKNKKALIENAKSKLDKKARKLALNALEAALEAADPKEIIRSKVTVKDNTLRIGQHKFDLKKFRRIYVVGGGKASGKMAEALESIFGNRISSGIVNIPYNSRSCKTPKIKLQEASHPIPDDAGMKGAKEMLDLVGHAEKNDLILCLISGGGSSLMPLPRGKITLNDKRRVTDALLKSGATINEVNTVRKHISNLKGGWLAKKAYPATIVNLILSDVIGDPLDFIASGPTVPDSTTFSDAVEILRSYHLWEDTPQSVKTMLVEGQERLIAETPKKGDKTFKKVYNIVVGNNRSATVAACNRLQKAGLRSLFLTSFLEGEARHVGTVLASIAEEVEASGNPLPKPCGIVAGGETTVTVIGEGKGGRNQEIALSAALKISGVNGVVIASLSTDGIEGPTEAAGALADGKTITRSLEQKLNAKSFLANNDSYSFFSKLDDLIFTGLTGTNVNDVSIIIALK
ncbi:MAG: glycerate kinase [Candidatus Bathyarchaeota archaeon]|nr:glycerate kinase [Candidatus Bathyarchaeota archaeon]